MAGSQTGEYRDVSKDQTSTEQSASAAGTPPDFEFETALGELEALVQSMEDGELSLEASLQAFESGIRITRQCQSALQAAEQKVQVLMSASDSPTPFSEVSEID